ncbi:MAG: 3-oxoacyl-ACP reductase [Legionellales bacterium]|nr:3-oxoacyl-ACP reductase [Legionellales bacterium]
MNLDGKVALVSGASRGIGRAIAIELGQQGATVVGTATSESGAKNIAEGLKAANVKGTGLVLNVTDRSSIDEVIKTVTSDFGNIDILVNNAAITRDNILLRMKDDEWHDIIETNLNSIFYMTKACIRGMVKARWGRIINISSVTGHMGNLGQANYAAAKAGMVGFSKCLAHEIASRNVTVNVVAPGCVETDMTKEIPEAHMDKLRSLIPMGRLAQPEEIAAAVGFLASPQASYITGETIHVNGGMYMN